MQYIYHNERKNVGIYIHVPFCLSKCHYCDFCSVLRADDGKKERYVTRLCEEIKACAERIGESGDVPVANTVYFGGGTPTLLTVRQFERILSTVDSCFCIADGAEITAETNPKTADGETLAELRRMGMNRLSIGMQSVHGEELRALGRIHSFADFLETYGAARKAGFDNLSVDLMYGIPRQTKESFVGSVQTLCRLAPEHISSYCLTIEDDTNFGRRRDSLVLPDEDIVGDMYADMTAILAEHGYEKYEISNFSRAGKESRHNTKYWKLDDYLGFGSAAHSFFSGVRFAHSRDMDAYIEGKDTIIEIERIGEQDAMDEFVMLGMRLSRGVSYADFYSRFGREFFSVFPNFKKYAPMFVSLDSGFCRFTEKGMFVSNAILADALALGYNTL